MASPAGAKGLRLIVIDASTIGDIDVTAGRMLGELKEEFEAKGIRLVVAGAVGRVRDLLVGDDLREDFVAGDMYDTVEQAVVDGPEPAGVGATRPGADAAGS